MKTISYVVVLWTIYATIISCTARVAQSKRDDSWYKVQFQPLCDEEKGIFLSKEKIIRYHSYNPYDTTQIDSKDSLIFAFNFISDCSLTFSGRAELKGDTLTLKYGFSPLDSAAGSDCFCEYRMKYRLSKKRMWSSIRVRYQRLIE